MNGFNLNRDLFYTACLDKGMEVWAIAAIEYPLIHIHATTLETADESYDQFDRYLITEVVRSGNGDIRELASITGISEQVFRLRGKVMEERGYMRFSSERILVHTEKAIEWMEAPLMERAIRRTRSFLLDGQDHQPLKAYFYKEGKDFMISEDRKDANGKKIFNPSLIHNPPSAGLKDRILSLDHDDRGNHNIPFALKDIIDYDFHLCTFPAAIVMGLGPDGQVIKELVNCNGFYSEREAMAPWGKKIAAEINNLTVQTLQIQKAEEGEKILSFRSSWGSNEPGESIIFCKPDLNHLSAIISRQYDINDISKDLISYTETSIELTVTKALFDLQGIKKKAILEGLVRRRDYLLQPPYMGVWLIFYKVTAGDEEMQRLTDLYAVIKTGLPMQQLLDRYLGDVKKLRMDLVLIGAFDYLERIDIDLFMYNRENKTELRYKKFNSNGTDRQ